MSTKPKKLQKWFDKKYSQKGKKESLNSITISDKQFKPSDGPLKIENFTTLENFDVNNFISTELSITDCPQLKKINLSKFTSNLLIKHCPKLTGIKFSDCDIRNLFMSDCSQITVLDFPRPKLISDLKISNFPKLTKVNLAGCHVEKLSVSNCPDLTTLDCKRTQLTDLDLSNHNFLKRLYCSENNLTELSVSNLIELDCSKNKIKYLILNLCPEITKLDCFNNQLMYLEISNCSKLETLNCSNNKLLTNLDISNSPQLGKIINKDTDLKLIIERGKKAKNILIIGRTGGGKSTLSNVLSDSEEFNESESSVSITKNFQKKTFKHEEMKYSVIDTIGVGDTKLTRKEVLLKIAEGIYSMPEGISHVLFVVDGRFTAEEIETFSAFERALFESGIVGYVTIVRTKFSNFKDPDACEKDRKELHNESKKIAGIVSKCKHIFYVDNPPVNIKINDDDDRDTVEINKKIRKTSRRLLLDYLDKVCLEECLKECYENDRPLKEYLEKHGKDQGQFLKENCRLKCYYKLKSWDDLRGEISVYIEQLGPQNENLEEIMDKIVEIMERRLNPEIPTLFRAFINIKDSCTIS